MTMRGTPKLLMLVADPSASAEAHLDWGHEQHTILDQVRTEHGDAFDVEVQAVVGRDSPIDALYRHEPVIVHFTGHGEASGVMLPGDDGMSVPTTGADLRRVFHGFRKGVRLVVLNACSSVEQARALSQEIGCVVGHKGTISDVGASIFAGAFYRALAHG